MTESQKYYVYVHRYASGPRQGDIFYVGKGTGRRVTRRHGRNPHWQAIVKKHGFTAEILKQFDNEVCAYTYEKIIISMIGSERLCNFEAGGFGGKAMRVQATAKMVYRSDGSVFNSIAEAARSVGGADLGVRKVILGNWQTYKGYRWSDYCVPDRPSPAVRRERPISNGQKTFQNMTQCVAWARDNGFPKASKSHISQCCNGKRNKAYGHVWTFSD